MASRLTSTHSSWTSPVPAGQELRNIRERLHLSQSRFAARLGVHPVSLSHWETGARPVPTTVLYLSRFYLLWNVRPVGVVPAPEPALPSVHLSPSCRCYWSHNDPEPCGGRQYHLYADLSRRRHLETETCEAHMATAYAAVEARLVAAATAEQHRWRKVLQMRERRRQAREAAAAQPTP
jgi:DNA-binding XRE family transcriptional regulator